MKTVNYQWLDEVGRLRNQNYFGTEEQHAEFIQKTSEDFKTVLISKDL